MRVDATGIPGMAGDSSAEDDLEWKLSRSLVGFWQLLSSSSTQIPEDDRSAKTAEKNQRKRKLKKRIFGQNLFLAENSVDDASQFVDYMKSEHCRIGHSGEARKSQLRLLAIAQQAEA